VDADRSGPRVSAWADVAHSLTRSVGRRALAAERGLSGIPLLGEWRKSGQRPASPNPPPPPARVWRTSRPSQSPRRRDHPRETSAPTRCDGRRSGPGDLRAHPVVMARRSGPTARKHHGTDQRGGYPPELSLLPRCASRRRHNARGYPCDCWVLPWCTEGEPTSRGDIRPSCRADLPGRPSRPSCSARPVRRGLSGLPAATHRRDRSPCAPDPYRDDLSLRIWCTKSPPL
jgi:hypothetical protein